MRTNLTKKEIIRKKKDIDSLFRYGKRISAPGLRIVFRKNELGYTRGFFTLVRKFGNSIQRNRAKRLIKEVFRIQKHELEPGWDLAFILFPGNTDFHDLNQQVSKLFSRAGLFFNH
ncbi:MAG: ribonuclease P protein component [Spirochaetales bacterium]|nr:ribonuclease P protein component [Spirochaetales bacterium]